MTGRLHGGVHDEGVVTVRMFMLAYFCTASGNMANAMQASAEM